MQLGSNFEQMHLSLSSDQSMTGVFENTCLAAGDQCHVPVMYDWKKSTTHKSSGMLMEHTAEMFGNNQKLLENNVIGIGYSDTMNFELHEYERETTVLAANFVANYDSELPL